jgi:hypothetical protein
MVTKRDLTCELGSISYLQAPELVNKGLLEKIIRKVFGGPVTHEEAIAAVCEALEMGLHLSVRVPSGDFVYVGPALITKRKTFEYLCQQTLGSFVSRDKMEVAKLAVECGGKKIGKEAERTVITFVRSTKNLLS